MSVWSVVLSYQLSAISWQLKISKFEMSPLLRLAVSPRPRVVPRYLVPSA